MSKVLRVGIVGVGQRGLAHLSSVLNLQQNERVQLTALADPFRDNLAEDKIQDIVPEYKQGNIKMFSNGSDLLESGLVDLVWFALPPNRHAGEAELAARLGIAAMLEKPQSLFLDEAVRQANEFEKSGTPSMVGFQQRYDAGYTQLRAWLKGKNISAMTMVSLGNVENHSKKYTHTEALGGPENRIWAANTKWSGTSIVEAGIHQTDIMRYWTNDNISWVQAAYTERPKELWGAEGDNPVAYTVTYGFEKGAVGNVLFARPSRTYFTEDYSYIVGAHATIKVDIGREIVAYAYNGAASDPHPSRNETMRVINEKPFVNPMGAESTLAMCEALVDSVALNKPELRRNSAQSSLNSLAAVLAANTSHKLNGERIWLKEFLSSGRFAPFRQQSE